MRQLAAHASSRAEYERKELARELHDELGQVLTALKMDASYLKDHLSPEAPARLPTKAAGMVAAIDGIIQSVRRIAVTLRPPVLDRLGLLDAIEWQARELERHGGIRCTFTSSGASIETDTATTTHVFRIVQEALTNVVRHARASRVTIAAAVRRRRLVVEIRDNGSGIPKGALADPGSLGLVGMRERALAIGGTLTVTRGPRRGTIARISAPLAAHTKPGVRRRRAPAGR